MTRMTALLSALLLTGATLLGTQLRLQAQALDEPVPAQVEQMMENEDAPFAPLADEDGTLDEQTFAPEEGTEPVMTAPAVPQPAVAEPPQPVLAAPQTAASPARTQSDGIVLKAGDILEILPVHTIDNASYAWILTQDRRFIQADRNKMFRIRLTEPGTYTLTAEVTSADRMAKVRNVFTVVIEQRTPGLGEPKPPAATRLVETLPAIGDGDTVVMSEQGRTLSLVPTGNLRPLNIDFDVTSDSDRNGNPRDDVDNVGSLFQTDSTPLLLWFLEPVTRREMTLSALKGDGTLQTQNIAVLGFMQAREQGLLPSAVSIQSATVEGRSVQFSAVFAPGTRPDSPLLFRWSFSDGTESLETQPTHTFPEGDQFSVTLNVRNLMTGMDIGTATKTVVIATPSSASSASATGSAMSAASQASSTDTETPASTVRGGGLMGRITPLLPLLGAFVGAVIVGMIIVAILSALRRKKTGTEKEASLQKHFQEMESKLAKKQEAPAVVATSATTVTTPPQSVAEREKERDAQRPAAPASSQQQSAPSWLKQGLQGKTVAATPAPAAPKPAPAPIAPPPVPKPAPAAPVAAPKPQPTPPPAPAKPAPVPTPASAKPSTVTPTPPAPTPAPAVQPPAPPVTPAPAAPAVAQNPVPTPAPAPSVPAPEPKPQAVAAAQAPVTPPAPPVTQTPAPTQKPAVSQTPPAPTPVPTAPPAPVSTPGIDTQNAPSWLKQGLQGKPDFSTSAAVPTPAPAPQIPPQATPSTPKEDPTVAVITVENLGKQA